MCNVMIIVVCIRLFLLKALWLIASWVTSVFTVLRFFMYLMARVRSKEAGSDCAAGFISYSFYEKL